MCLLRMYAHVPTQKLKDAKVRYRHAFDSLKDLRGSLEPLAESVGHAKQELIQEFDKWLELSGPDALQPQVSTLVCGGECARTCASHMCVTGALL